MNEGQTQGFLDSVRSSQLLRVMLIGFLILLLQIPVTMIHGVISEREQTRNDALHDVTGKWGKEQSFSGPIIVVPYLKKWSETDKEGKKRTRSAVRYASFLPEILGATGTVSTEVRHRGIFEFPVYTLSLVSQGHFTRPDLSEWEIAGDDILWDRAYLSVPISDARAIKKGVTLDWNGSEIDFLPGAGEAGSATPGIHANLKEKLTEKRVEFSFALQLNGSEAIYFAPVGKQTKISLTSGWPHPSFQGNWLPTTYTVDASGFSATWDVPYLGRNYPQKWRSEEGVDEAVSASLFGVRLITPVDHYRMAERSVKYEFLFLALTFATLWLFEVLMKLRIHPIQYLMVGVGMCLFYVLELSLAEHIGFVAAYVLASAAVVILIAGYCLAILKAKSRGVVMGTVVGLLYGYLYILLMNQDYALLVGSIGLFVITATVMYLTRKIDWYAVRSSRGQG